MGVLILGNAEHTFVKNLLIRLAHHFPEESFTIASSKRGYWGTVQNIDERKFVYSKHFIMKVTKLRVLFSIIQKRKFFESFNDGFDLCHIHYIDIQSSLLAKLLSKKCSHIISSVWGSDFYRSSEKVRRLQENLYNVSSIITFTNEKSMMEFDKYYGKRYSSKLRICRFGLTPLEVLRKLDIDKKECRNCLGLPEESIIVTVGYNNSPAQQHIEILNSIEKHKREIPENVFLVLPMTYGATDKYRNTVRKHLEQHGFKYRIFDKFVPDREMAMLRKASDLMIQVQITDQFSGSMQEHLYTENIVITGDWLPYGALDEKGVFMLKVSSVEEVGEKLVYAVNNLDSLKEKCKKNPEIIWELSSWEKNIKSWIDMYEELLQKRR